MKKIIHPCDVPQWDGRKYPLFAKIEFENGRLSISGVIGPYSNGDAAGGCGQIDMEFDHKDPQENDSRYKDPIKASALRFSGGWNRSMWYKFLHIWHKWHLNDMHSGCEHQDSMGWTYEDHHGVYLPDDSRHIIDEYDTGETILKFHPYLGEACPVCGYRIGSAWTFREVPEDVIEFLFSLPDTDRQPAWV